MSFGGEDKIVSVRFNPQEKKEVIDMSLGYNVVFRDGYYDVIDLTDGSWLGSFSSMSAANEFIDSLLIFDEVYDGSL